MKRFIIARFGGDNPNVLNSVIKDFRTLAEAECWCDAKSEDGRYVYMIIKEVTK